MTYNCDVRFSVPIWKREWEREREREREREKGEKKRFCGCHLSHDPPDDYYFIINQQTILPIVCMYVYVCR